MTVFLILATLTGAVLGTRFKVFVVIPLMLLSIVAIASWAVLSEVTWGTGGFFALCAAGAIQLGYLVGFSLSAVVASDPVKEGEAAWRTKRARQTI
jgi:hypothetical protein